MPDGDKGKKTDTYSSERAGGESGQASIECERTETSQEGSVLPEVAGAGGKEGVAASGKADGADRAGRIRPDTGQRPDRVIIVRKDSVIL